MEQTRLSQERYTTNQNQLRKIIAVGKPGSCLPTDLKILISTKTYLRVDKHSALAEKAYFSV